MHSSWWLEMKKTGSEEWRDMLSLTQVLSYFDNYLLASVILVALAITLIMLYISCYAWVFRVSATCNTKKHPILSHLIIFAIKNWIQGNLDLPKPAKAFSIKGRLDSFKPARQGGSRANKKPKMDKSSDNIHGHKKVNKTHKLTNQPKTKQKLSTNMLILETIFFG